MSETPQKGFRPGVYRLVSGTVTGGVWSADQGSGIPQEGFNPGVLKTVTVSINPDESTVPDSEDPGIYRTVNGFVTNEVYSNQEQPAVGFIPGIFKSAPDGSPVPREGFIRGQAGIVIGSISDGKWRGSPVIINAVTTDLVGSATPASITFDLTGCLYVTGSNGNSLGSLFTYYLDSGSGPVEILKTLATYAPTSPWEPIPQTWQVTFGSTTIGDARGDADQFWKDGDVLTMELNASFASLLQIRPDCVFANIDEANDIVASAIGITPVNNLYTAPLMLSATVISPTQLSATFDQNVDDTGNAFAIVDPLTLADGVLLGGTSTPTGGALWVQLGDPLGLIGGLGGVIANGITGTTTPWFFGNIIDITTPDMDLSAILAADLNWGTGSLNGLAFRTNSAGVSTSGYKFGYRFSTASYAIASVAGGSETTLDSVAGPAFTPAGTRLQVICVGTNIKCYVGGELVFNFTDTLYNANTFGGMTIRNNTGNSVLRSFDATQTTYTPGFVASNCTTALPLPISRSIGGGAKTLSFDHTGVVNPGDVVAVSAAGVPADCIGSSYQPTVANLGGTTALRQQIAVTHQENEFTLSLWVKRDLGSPQTKIYDAGDAATAGAETSRLRYNASAQLASIVSFTPDNGTTWNRIADLINTGTLADNTYEHVYLTFRNDVNAGPGSQIMELGLNGVVVGTETVFQGGSSTPIDFIAGDFLTFFSRHDLTEFINGGVADVWTSGVYMDASTHMPLFRSPAGIAGFNGSPVNLGVSGVVNGVTPGNYFGGAGYSVLDWNNGLNRGTNADFTLVGGAIT